MKKIIVVFLLTLNACSTLPKVASPVDAVPILTGEVKAEGGMFVSYDPASTIEKSFAEPAITLMNQCYQSGKLKELWLSHKFVSFNTVFDVSPHTNLDAWNAYIAGAPYALNLNWYRTGSPFSNVLGYTYNFYNNDWNSDKSETRIWSNSRIVSGYSAKDVASHWAHELSHQIRAGGFVHYTIFDGSTPYEAGDIMSECLR